ncbi:hypothetical protein HG530_006983 [Fusarium avenaceum]|nr:hypothetical protein HG530_006983 [Fusarium avenaceum]
MKRLRRPDREVCLWIDFICINQVDKDGDENSEKSKQISLMTEIYSKADRVLVWLGEPGAGMERDISQADLQKAVDYIEKIGDLDSLDHIANVDTDITYKAGHHNLDPVFRLFRCGWFSRRWVVQEVAVARKAILHCGTKSVSWEKFAHAVALLERVGRDGSINRMLKMKPETRHVSEYAGNISALPAYRLVQNTHEVYQGRHADGEQGKYVRQRTLEQLVCFLAVFQASRPHDTIYAVLGIASDFRPKNGSQDNKLNSEREEFNINYEQNALRVFKHFIKQVVSKSKSLDILCRPWAPDYEISHGEKKKITLPSWIMSIKHKPFQSDKHGKMFRYNPDPLVGAAISRLKFFTASGLTSDRQDKQLLKIDDESETSDITVWAFKLCHVSEVFDCAIFGNIASSWLKVGGWTDDSRLPPEAFWRTLVANRTSQGTAPDPWYPRAFLSAVREKGIRYGINTHQLIHEKDNAAYSEVFRRVQEVTWNRRLIKTSPIDGYGQSLGLVPEECQNGDLICIVLVASSSSVCVSAVVLASLVVSSREVSLAVACSVVVGIGVSTVVVGIGSVVVGVVTSVVVGTSVVVSISTGVVVVGVSTVVVGIGSVVVGVVTGVVTSVLGILSIAGVVLATLVVTSLKIALVVSALAATLLVLSSLVVAGFEVPLVVAVLATTLLVLTTLVMTGL